MSGGIVSRGTITLEAARCKGCELCIPACPPRVLRMSETRNQNGYAVPELLAGCTGCGACLLVCPDFCFEIYQYETPVVYEGKSCRALSSRAPRPSRAPRSRRGAASSPATR
jgi:2-oxoglutarate ferredoxin oxidoreductase subunit delta